MDILKDYIRVAIYARVSTEHEAQMSALENQIDWYESEMKMHPNWHILGRYIDKGITGTSATKRPEFMRMMDDASKGNFDLVITREISRFARNTVDALNYTRKLKKMGVEVYFINDGIKTFDNDGELRLTIMSSLAQDESRKISSRVKSGQRTSMEKGVFYGNGNIMGYDRRGKEMVINPEQAQVVKMIFEMYLSGSGLKQIKYKLEQIGVKTATGGTIWHEATISKMLTNSFYCGIIEYNKQFTPDYLEQKKINNHGQVERIKVKGSHEPIVSVEDFQRVQKILSEKRQKNIGYSTAEYGRGKKPAQNVWSKLLICECGRQFSRRVWHKTKNGKQYGYQCYSQASNGSKNERLKKGLPIDGFCTSKMFPEWKLKMMAKYIFRTYLSDVSRIVELATKMLSKHIDDKESANVNGTIIKDLEAKIKKLEKRLDTLLDMRADGEIDKQKYIEKKQETESELGALNRQLAELKPPEQNAEEISIEDKLKILKAALDKYTNFSAYDEIPEEIIEAFVVKIVVHENSFDWYLRYCSGEYVIKCNIEGNKKSAKVVENDSQKTHTFDKCNTGCNQRRLIC